MIQNMTARIILAHEKGHKYITCPANEILKITNKAGSYLR